MWWSGVFAVAAFVHLLRALANMPVTIGTVAIPMWVSWVVFPVAGFISGWLMRIALERKEQRPFQQPPIAPGGLHPKSAGKEEPQHAGQTSRGQAEAPDWGNAWPED
jgi:hypothetical protein